MTSKEEREESFRGREGEREGERERRYSEKLM